MCKTPVLTRKADLGALFTVWPEPPSNHLQEASSDSIVFVLLLWISIINF